MIVMIACLVLISAYGVVYAAASFRAGRAAQAVCALAIVPVPLLCALTFILFLCGRR